MEDMLKDFTLGEQLLLVGNQGVGKNKIVDRFLHVLNRPREYIQLHRDTTVQTLTLQPTVQDGVIIYEDSPLVRAVKQGHVLVVDEADKAPTHVTCILKTLIESGEMHLADGRRIVSATSGLQASPQVIVAHPDFRMIVLANRPGFPFLGNDFFGAMGDIFSCHAIDNPDKDSEMSMLRQYGPDVPEPILEKLVLSFGELREMADQGLIAYPYSTREVVNMVRHLQKYPNEGLTSVIKNVFDFDSYNSELREVLITTMQKHGIPLSASADSIKLAKEFPLPDLELVGHWKIQGQGQRKVTSLMALPVETSRLGVKGPVSLRVESLSFERTESRAKSFSEQEAFWNVPVHETNIISDLTVSLAAFRSPGHNKNDIIHVGTANPVGLYSMNPRTQTASFLDMYDVFPMVTGSYRPHVRIQALGAPLDDTVILHEEVTNTILSVNFETGEVNRLLCPSLQQTQPEKRKFTSPTQTKTSPYRMCKSTLPDEFGTVVFYKQNEDFLEVLGLLEGVVNTVPLPLHVQHVHQVAAQQWMCVESGTNKKFLVTRSALEDYQLQSMDEDPVSQVLKVSSMPMNEAVLSAAMRKPTSGPNRMLVTSDSYATVALGFPDTDAATLYRSPRAPTEDSLLPSVLKGNKPGTPSASPSIVYLPQCGQVVRAMPNWKAPEDVVPKDQRANISGFLEVTDLPNQKLRYIAVPG
ncbi:hypothetical protein DPMN_037582, partial [Dreissena polymorpha]